MKNCETIYLDYQATTPVDPRVFAEMKPYFETLFGNPHSTDHLVGWNASKTVDRSAKQLAKFIGCDVNEIFFTSGATESNNLALLGLCRRNLDKRRRRILLSSIEHKSVLAIGNVLSTQYDYDIQLIPVDKEGMVEISELQRLLDDDVLAVSIMAVNNEIGTIQDITLISQLVRNVGAIFHCDAAQAPEALEIKTFSESVDLMSLSSHKMWGPKGIGVLYIQHNLQDLIEPLIYGGGQQNGIRSGTVPVPLCVGMGRASEIYSSIDSIYERQRIASIRDEFIKNLLTLPYEIMLNGPRGGGRHPGNINVCFKGFSSHEILGILQPRLAASTGSACASGIEEPSHVLKAIGLNDSDAKSSIRFSIARNTSTEMLIDATNLIKNALKSLNFQH